MQTQDHANDLGQDIERTEKTLANIPTRKRKLFELFETNELSKEDFLERKEELRELDDDLRQSLDEKKQALYKLESRRIDREVFEETIRNFEARFKKGDPAKQKADLATVIEHITVKDRQFKVSFRHSPHPD